MPQRQNPDTFTKRNTAAEVAGGLFGAIDYSQVIVVGSFGPFRGLASPYFCDPGSQIILAAATSVDPCDITLPAAIGDGAHVIVKKMDNNAPNVNIAPLEPDQIYDAGLGPDSISAQFGLYHYLDVAPGQWVRVAKL